VYENPHLFVTRPVEPHRGGRATDAPVHLGDRDGPAGLAFDLVQESLWDARRERKHGVRIARRSSQLPRAFASEAHAERL
jgi:hypothetical protein